MLTELQQYGITILFYNCKCLRNYDDTELQCCITITNAYGITTIRNYNDTELQFYITITNAYGITAMRNYSDTELQFYMKLYFKLRRYHAPKLS